MKKYEQILHKISGGHILSRLELHEGISSLLELDDKNQFQMQMGMILFGIASRKPTVDEILGLADFVRDVEPAIFQNKLKSSRASNIISLAGSGKKGLKTLNVSTSSCLVAACAGAFISKPVSRATSSATGSADILREFGADLSISNHQMLGILEKTGFGAFQIENTIPKFDALYGGKFFAPHALSYVLAGLTNPIECDSIIYGLTGKNVALSAEAFNKLGFKKGVILTSTEDNVFFIDELSPMKTNIVSAFRNGVVNTSDLNPTEVFGCPIVHSNDIEVSMGIEKQRELFINNLRGKGSDAHQHMIAMNASVILMESGIENIPKKAFNLAVEIINSGAAEKKLDFFCDSTKKQIKPVLANLNSYERKKL